VIAASEGPVLRYARPTTSLTVGTAINVATNCVCPRIASQRGSCAQAKTLTLSDASRVIKRLRMASWLDSTSFDGSWWLPLRLRYIRPAPRTGSDGLRTAQI